MSKLHLSYDGNQTNGIIFNDKYTNGALYVGADLKPKLSFEYDSMQFSEVFNVPNYIIKADIKTLMSDQEASEVRKIASTWVQALGQEGNPTPEQKQERKNADARAYLNSTDWYAIRQSENGTQTPADIVTKREVARKSITESA